MNRLISLLLILGLLASNGPEKPQFSHPTDADLDALIAQMSIEEKVGQTCQITLDAIHKTDSKGQALIPAQIDQSKLEEAVLTYHVGSILNVGAHTLTREEWQGIMQSVHAPYLKKQTSIPILYGIDAIHGLNYTVGATLFPQEIGLAATWNESLAQQMGSVTAYECRASGIPWNFSPVLDLGRQPLWSRSFETLGEDPVLATKMGSALVKGYQGGSEIDQEHVAACLKHFVGYSAPLSGRDRTPAWIPDKYMHELYLPAFEKAVKDGALTLMINSGAVNGIPGHQNAYLLTDILKKKWGFKGFVVSDWEDFIMLHTVHRTAPSLYAACVRAFNAGIDMSMVPSSPQYKSYCQDMIKAVRNGDISMERLNDAVKRILYVKKQLGLFSNPVADFARYTKFGSSEFKAHAEQAALESITLLKNESHCLPLQNGKKILLVGPAANSVNLLNGAWTHTWQGLDTSYNTKGTVSIYQAFAQHYGAKNCQYIPGVELYLENGFEASRFVQLDAFKRALKKSDIVVVCAGEQPATEKPGDIRSLDLDDKQKELVRLAHAAHKQVLLVLVEARPRIIADIEPLCAAVIQCYLPGDYGAPALVKLISGAADFSGHLPYTYPRYSGVMEFYDHPRSVDRDKNGNFSAYNPQWDFGFGLSYKEASIESTQLTGDANNGNYILNVTVKNPNPESVYTLIPVYASAEYSSLIPEGKRLLDFQKIKLSPQSSQTISFEISAANLKRVQENGQWIAEKGSYILQVGQKTSTLHLNKDIHFEHIK
ncbi:MAG: hypothetical protein RLZZ301_136 [Bacteroidota bacterium]|jgi:beta-glucosidase